MISNIEHICYFFVWGPDPLFIDLTHLLLTFWLQKHAILYNKCVYISNNMTDFWPLSVSIESMGNILLLGKIFSLPSVVKPT